MNVSSCASKPCGTYPCIEAPNSNNGYLCQCGKNDFRTTDCKESSDDICPADACGDGEFFF